MCSSRMAGLTNQVYYKSDFVTAEPYTETKSVSVRGMTPQQIFQNIDNQPVESIQSNPLVASVISAQSFPLYLPSSCPAFPEHKHDSDLLFGMLISNSYVPTSSFIFFTLLNASYFIYLLI